LLGQHPGGLRIVRRYYPRMRCLPKGEHSCLPLRIALCAGEQGKFWQADRWLFEHVTWRSEIASAEAARDIGLELGRFDDCLGRDDTYARAAEAWSRARKLRIPGTPYYLVGGKAVPESELSRLLRAL
jgi:protein-disulfide isomerase